jgi:GNAT superfamily N-acetyltransferase
MMRFEIAADPTEVWEEIGAFVLSAYKTMYGDESEAGPQDMSLLRPPTGGLVVAYAENGEIAGCGGWVWLHAQGYEPHTIPSNWPWHTAELKRLFVRNEYRGQGLSKAIEEHRVAHAHRAGVRFMVGEAGDPQKASLALRESLGYIGVAPFGHQIGNPESNFFGRWL